MEIYTLLRKIVPHQIDFIKLLFYYNFMTPISSKIACYNKKHTLRNLYRHFVKIYLLARYIQKNHNVIHDSDKKYQRFKKKHCK